MFSYHTSLIAWGWDESWDSSWLELSNLYTLPKECVAARVVGRDGPIHRLETPEGPRDATVSGRWQYSRSEIEQPVVGDWVTAQVLDERQAVVHAVLERRTTLSRAVSSKSNERLAQEKLLASNVDVLFVVTALDANFNVERARRFATLARHGGMTPVWVLTKADVDGAEEKIAQARRAALGDPVVALSVASETGIELLSPWLGAGRTVALVGSSGVGKTTLVNRLTNGTLATQSVRSGDSKGRHTTTSRHLYALASGALVLDTPGIRSVGLWADELDVDANFPIVAQFARECRFHDCRHENEPGCAVAEAVERGEIPTDVWRSWLKQQRELRFLERKTDRTAQDAEKRKWKDIHTAMRGWTKEKRSGSSDA